MIQSNKITLGKQRDFIKLSRHMTCDVVSCIFDVGSDVSAVVPSLT